MAIHLDDGVMTRKDTGMKVYLVVISGGWYEDKWTLVDSVWSSKESAVEHLKTFEDLSGPSEKGTWSAKDTSEYRDYDDDRVFIQILEKEVR